MNKTLVLLFLAASSLQAYAADAIPKDLAGEWRNSKSKTAFAVLYLLPDGRGGFAGFNEGDAIGDKITATYDSRQHRLTITTTSAPKGAKGQTYRFDYDSTTKTLTGSKSVWGAKPFHRVSPQVSEIDAEGLR